MKLSRFLSNIRELVTGGSRGGPGVSTADPVAGVIGGRSVEIVEKALNAAVPPLPEELAAASMSLTNPEMRVELPADFPPILDGSFRGNLAGALRKEMEKRGMTLEEAGHINIAYPHKHPVLYPGHQNNAADVLNEVKQRLQDDEPGIEWRPVDGLVERVRLGRSENQTSVHAITAQQVFDIHMASQKTPLPLGPQHGKKEFFIVVDTGAEQGTTYANMISYILHNGGTVLAAVSGYTGGVPLRQKTPDDDKDLRQLAKLKPEFNDASRNTGQLARMALAFADSARESGKDWTPAQCLEMFEDKLGKLGNTVFALTNGEAERLIDTVNKNYYRAATFVEILDQLDRKIEAKAALKPAEVTAQKVTL